MLKQADRTNSRDVRFYVSMQIFFVQLHHFHSIFIFPIMNVQFVAQL